MESSGESSKRLKLDTAEADVDIFDAEDSDEQFEGFDMPSDDEEGLGTIDSGAWEEGAPDERPAMRRFENSLMGLRNKDLPQNPTFLDYYKLFVPDHVITTITVETNR